MSDKPNTEMAADGTHLQVSVVIQEHLKAAEMAERVRWQAFAFLGVIAALTLGVGANSWR